MKQRCFGKLLASTAVISLTACGGGGSGDGNRFRTQDFKNTSGLDQIRAAEGFAQITGRQGGDGVRIAIIDDGVDENHPDITPNLKATVFFNDSGDVNSQHGTAVAGIAAGAGGNGGIQGVAFNADLFALQAGDQDPEDPTSVILDNDAIIAAIDAATSDADTESDILNLSLGGSLTGPVLTNENDTTFLITDEEGNVIGQADAREQNAEDQALQAAIERSVDAGKLLVIAAGNEGEDLAKAEDDLGLPRGSFVTIGPDVPATPAANSPASQEGVIVAVAVDANNQLAAFSNSCFTAPDRCLAAPGVEFQGALPGGGIGDIGDGTSYSAPLITGAAAVVQAAFPGTTPQEAGNRLLTTATDLGDKGVDQVFGRGLLNLENALRPQGELSVATSNSLSGPRSSLSSSKLSLGSSLALNGAGADLLNQVVSFDKDDFPFAVDLGGAAKTQSRTTGLDAFIGSSGQRVTSVSTATMRVSLSLAEDSKLSDPYRAEFAASDTQLKAQPELPRVQLQSEAVEGVDTFFAFNGSSSLPDGLVQSLPEDGDFLQPSNFLAPFDQLAGAQTGGGVSVELGDNTDLTVSAFATTDRDADRQSFMQKAEFVHRTAGDIQLRLGYGFMQEDRGFLGSEAGGAFGAKSDGNSQYVNVSFLAPVSERVSLFGAYSRGNTDVSGGSGSLLSDYSAVGSEAFGAGFVMTGLADDNDGFTFMVGQPLRVTEGSAEVTVPVGRTEDGNVLQQRAKVDLSPSTREVAFEAVYNFDLDDDDQSLSAGSFFRLNPDHDSDADPDLGLGIKYQLKF